MGVSGDDVDRDDVSFSPHPWRGRPDPSTKKRQDRSGRLNGRISGGGSGKFGLSGNDDSDRTVKRSGRSDRRSSSRNQPTPAQFLEGGAGVVVGAAGGLTGGGSGSQGAKKKGKGRGTGTTAEISAASDRRKQDLARNLECTLADAEEEFFVGGGDRDERVDFLHPDDDGYYDEGDANRGGGIGDDDDDDDEPTRSVSSGGGGYSGSPRSVRRAHGRPWSGRRGGVSGKKAAEARWSKERMDRFGCGGGDHDDDDEYQTDTDTYEYEMGSPRMTSWGNRAAAGGGAGGTVAGALGVCLCSLARALRWHYGPICFLVICAGVTIAVLAIFAEEESDRASGLYFNLTAEDRFVTIRTMIIDAGVSLDGDLPEYDEGCDGGDGMASARCQALRWVANEDPMCLDPDHPELLSRYALAVLFRSTGGRAIEEEDLAEEADGLMEGTPEEEDDSDGRSRATWIKRDGWMSGRDMCSWSGVSCDIHVPEETSGYSMADTVTGLDLSNNGLIGSVPPEVGALENLRILDLGRNEIGGTIPEVVGELTELVTLNLKRNNLNGTIPTLDLPKLQNLDLSNNGGLGGPIPPTVGDCASLKNVDLQDNEFTGSVPESVGQLEYLTSFVLEANGLTGTLPADALGRLENLVHFRIGLNEFTGPLPESVLSLPYLEEFEVCHNSLTGTLPDHSFYRLSHLRVLAVCDNVLWGTLPPSLCALSELETLQVYNNDFDGPIPTRLGELEDLSRIELSHNRLTGTIPEEFCDLDAEITITADCGGDNPSVSCGCCECFF